MFTKMSPIEYVISSVIPGDLVVVRFKSQEDSSYKIRKSSFMRSEIKYKAVNINVDLHIHYWIDESHKKEKTTSAGLQEMWTSGDGSIREHRMVFVVPGFDVSKLAKASIYISTNSLSVMQITDIVVQVRKEKELEHMAENKLVFVSTWGIKCGISTYTGFLVDALNYVIKYRNNEDDDRNNRNEEEIVRNEEEIVRNEEVIVGIVGDKKDIEIEIIPINEGTNIDLVYAKIAELEHEFGIMSSPPRISKNTKCLICFHTILTDVTEDGLGVDSLIGMGMGEEVEDTVGGGGTGRGLGMQFTIKRFESSLGGLVGYIIHNKESKRVLESWTDKDIHIVPHGSYQIPDIDKKSIRQMFELSKVGIGIDDKVGFVFGLQSIGKNYKDLVEVGKRVGMKIVISGGKHEKIKRNIVDDNVIRDRNVIFLDRFLTELEINQYALASDILLFDYGLQDHYSVSGALHRLIGAGRPCIVSATRHFLDVRDDGSDGVLKFSHGDKDDLERKIREGLERSEELGRNARKFAEKTSWENVARQRLEIYRKYVDL